VAGESRADGVARIEIANTGGGSVWLEEPTIAMTGPVSSTPAAARLPGRPSIVVFLVDTLRADALGGYGQPAATSPRFDAFAREAIVFEDAWAQAPWTRSAVASIFTGLHVGTHGLDRVDRQLSAELPTLAESLHAGGYRTAGFSANPVVSRRFGFDQGFESWDEEEELRWDPASALVSRALRWLDGVRGPFFLYVHALDPHSPYAPAPEHASPFALPSYRGETDTKVLLERAGRGAGTAAELSFLRARYQGEVRQSDAAFGQLLDGLRARGLLDGSLVVFTSDHGEEFLEHGGTEHGKTLYQEVIRIPLAVRLPGAARGGTRSADVVQQIDVMPTLLALVGRSAPQGVEGRDLSASWVGNGGRTREPAVLFSEVRFEQADKVSARSGPLKLIVNLDPVGSWRADRFDELYDLAADPGEKVNLAASKPIDVRYLRNRIEGLKSLQAAHSARAEGSRVELSPEDLEQLRALGYVQ
jgi:arylsulfatase A-like enzyme